MSEIYHFFDHLVAQGILPEMFGYEFLINAMLASLMIGPLLGMLGTLVVVKRLAFLSEAVGHSVLTGVSIGILLGELPRPLLSACSASQFYLRCCFSGSKEEVPFPTTLSSACFYLLHLLRVRRYFCMLQKR